MEISEASVQATIGLIWTEAEFERSFGYQGKVIYGDKFLTVMREGGRGHAMPFDPEWFVDETALCTVLDLFVQMLGDKVGRA